MSNLLVGGLQIHTLSNPMDLNGLAPARSPDKITLFAQKRFGKDERTKNPPKPLKRKFAAASAQQAGNRKKRRRNNPGDDIREPPTPDDPNDLSASSWNPITALNRILFSAVLEGNPSEGGEASGNIEPVWMVEFFSDNRGHPWDQIRELKSALSKEQLIHLWDLCQYRSAEKPIAYKIFAFALKLAAWEEQLQIQMSVSPISHFFGQPQHSLKETLGKLIYLIDQDLLLAASLLSPDNLTFGCQEIERLFALEMDLRLDRFKQYIDSHKASGLHKFQRVIAARIPIEIAEALVTSAGSINIGIASVLKKTYLAKGKLEYAYENVLSTMLDAIENSSDFRHGLLSVGLPDSPECPSFPIVRICLGLNAGTPLTESHFRKTALSALLSHLRQGSVGSCFATAFAMEKLCSHPLDCLEDFAELLRNGKLTRQVGDDSIDFIPLVKMRHEILETKMTIDQEGRVVHQSKPACKVWEVPGIIAACLAAGIDEVELFAARILSELQRQHPDKTTFKLTIQAFLERLVSFACDKRFELIEGKTALINRALFAFEAQTQNPLQRIWENALAGMSEGRPKGLVKSSHIDALINPLHDNMKKINISFFRHDYRPEIEKCIREELISRLRILFDPNIHYVHPEKDDHSKYGGFVSYDTKDKEDPFSWERIDSPVKYVRFISSVLNQARKKQSSCSQLEAKAELNRIYRRLSLYIHTKHFLRNCLRECDSSNLAEIDLISNLYRLKCTPWIVAGGNNENEIDLVYHNGLKSLHQTKMTVSNAKGLLGNLIDFARKVPNELKDSLKKNPYLILALCIEGKHCFSALLGHPTMVKAWDSDLSAKKWINDFVVAPGVECADAIATPLTRNCLLEYIKCEFVKPKDSDIFDRLVKDIPSQVTIKHFRSKITDILKGLLNGKESKFHEILCSIDSYLVEHALPMIQKEKFIQHVIHFADTNWFEEMRDLHFCFLVNPGDGELEVWRVQDDNRGFQALNQNKWVAEQTWSISLKKNDVPG